MCCRRQSVDTRQLESRPRLPQLVQFKWRVDVAISTRCGQHRGHSETVFLLSLFVSFFLFVGPVSPSSLWLVAILVTAGIYCDGFCILTMPCHNTFFLFLCVWRKSGFF